MKIDRGRVFNKYDSHCSYCGRILTFKTFQVDHMTPKCCGLSDCDNFDNLMPTCRKCNHYKRGDTLEGFRRSMLTLHQRLEKIYILEVAVNFCMA